MTPLEKQHQNELFIKIQATLKDQGVTIKDLKQLQALMIGNITITRVGFVTIFYLNGDKLCTFTQPEKNNGIYTYKYNDELCQLKLSTLTVLITRLYKLRDLLQNSLSRLRRRF